jgi:hypothetical protein
MPRNMSYLENLMKEAKQSFRAYQATGEASQKSGPGTDEYANYLAGKESKQNGQFIGALLQGRRYDDKTGKQIKKKAKGK